VDRINSGERIEPAEVFADHPDEIAAEILEQLEAFQEIDFEFRPDPPLGTLGDFDALSFLDVVKRHPVHARRAIVMSH